ncbi:MAG: bacteriohemerythrin [Bacteroidota bacterium]|nr:bacteriohemerythrin [Bacteroidota bacterium]
MPEIEWTEKFSIGEVSIDKQHKQLISLLNEMFRQDNAPDCSKSFLTKKIQELKDYTKNHFSYEEKYMQEIGYPELEAHIAEHNQFIEKVNQIEKDFTESEKNTNIYFSVQIKNYLRSWLVRHIIQSDRKYSDFLTK